MFKTICVMVVACAATSQVLGQPPELEGYPLNLEENKITLPQISDGALKDRLQDAVFYKLRPAYQHYVPGSYLEQKDLTLGTVNYTFQKAIWGVYYTSYLEKLNANSDFPWEGTVGLNAAIREGNKNYQTVNFLSLPKKDGKVIPVLILNETPHKWIFPCDTMVGEIVMVWHKDKWWVQEIRTRIKLSKSESWDVLIHRPFSDRSEFFKLANIQPARLSKKHMHFRNPEETEVFKMDGLIERLPELPESTVEKVLSRTFKDVTYEYWSNECSVPTSDQDFSLVPKDYSLGLIFPEEQTCASCHKQTQISVRNLIPFEPVVRQNPRGMGNIRGCDGIFSWYPWDKSSIRENDEEAMQATTQLRAYDTKNGIVQVFDPRKASVEDDVYKLTKYCQESLKSYEIPKTEQFLHEHKEQKVDVTEERPVSDERATEETGSQQ